MGVGQMGNKNKQRHCPRHMEIERNIRAQPREAPAQASLDTGEALELTGGTGPRAGRTTRKELS